MDVRNELRECNHSGMLRSANRATNTVWSEETNVIRTPTPHSNSPLDTGLSWYGYFLKKNNIFGAMYAERALDDLKILRFDYKNKPRLLQLPNKEGYYRFSDLPNATFDNNSSKTPLYNKPWLFRDPVGTSGGAPRYGRSNIVLNELYNGNPWGAGGRDFIAIGNQHRDPGYAENTLKPILKNKGSSIPPSRKLKKRVTWQN